MFEFLNRLICRLRDHVWTHENDPDHGPNYTKRLCSRCHQEDWLFTNPYPRVGEPASEWKNMERE